MHTLTIIKLFLKTQKNTVKQTEYCFMIFNSWNKNRNNNIYLKKGKLIVKI